MSDRTEARILMVGDVLVDRADPNDAFRHIRGLLTTGDADARQQLRRGTSVERTRRLLRHLSVAPGPLRSHRGKVRPALGA